MPAMPAGAEKVSVKVSTNRNPEGSKGKSSAAGLRFYPLRAARSGTDFWRTTTGAGSDVYSVTSFTELARDGRT